MNFDEIKLLLQKESRDFFELHKLEQPTSFALKFNSQKNLPIRAITEQIKCYQKAIKKLPGLCTKTLIYESVALEQASSEATAVYKSSLVSGKRIIDLTGGLGVDSIFFSKNFYEVFYCEDSEILCEIFKKNLIALNIKNVKADCRDGIAAISGFPNEYFDWIYIDPSRRDGQKRSVGLEHCRPNILIHLKELFYKSENLLVKTSPAIDFIKMKRQLPHLKEFIVVSLNGECKEILLNLNRNSQSAEVKIKAVLLTDENQKEFVRYENDNYARQIAAKVLTYFYEPDAAIIKARLTEKLAEQFSLFFINDSIDYLTSATNVVNFPGRIFEVVSVFIYNKKKLSTYLKVRSINKANIARRDFPDSPETIRKNFHLKDGGDDYLFFTKNQSKDFIVIHCRKK
ncbi:MAG: hypothetical protein NTX22_16295 [Ignavibacteriales bacterium]|nr:hypothetical protein [Ignavibacteriales bacterium]